MNQNDQNQVATVGDDSAPVFDIQSMGAPAQTTYELKSPHDGETPTGIILHGSTTDSREWQRLAKQIMAPPKDERQAIVVNKDRPDDRRFEVDPEFDEKRRKLCCEAVTNMTGNARYVFGKQSFREMYMSPEYNWMHEQWSEHLSDTANYFLECPVYVEPLQSAGPGSQPTTSGEALPNQSATDTQPALSNTPETSESAQSQ